MKCRSQDGSGGHCWIEVVQRDRQTQDNWAVEEEEEEEEEQGVCAGEGGGGGGRSFQRKVRVG